MVEQKLMTEDEKVQIMLQAIDLDDEGKAQEAKILRRTLPVSPFTASFIKKYLGLEALTSMDLNFAEVEQAYGKEWLTH